jgi:hypothetical protein
VPASQRRFSPARRERLVWLALQVFILSLVFLQRLAAPGGVALNLPVGYACLGVILLVGGAGFDRWRIAGYLGAITTATVATVVSTATGGDPSLASLALLIVVYLPLTLILSAELHHLYRRMLVLFERCLLVVAVLGVTTALLQLVGWTFEDYLGRLPASFLVQGFNTTYPAFYGSPFVKTNALVCLEPSMLSIFMALGIITCLLVRGSWYHVAIFVGGLVSSLSGSGVLLLLAGLLVLAFRRGPRTAGAIAVTTGVVTALILITPPGALLAERVNEVSNPNSSANARFVQPYASMLKELDTGPRIVLVGDGPGSITSKNEDIFQRSGRSPLDTVATKLVREYGIPAALAFAWFLYTVFRRPTSATLALIGLLLYLLLSGGLLQPEIVYVTFLLSGLFREPASPDQLPKARKPRIAAGR